MGQHGSISIRSVNLCAMLQVSVRRSSVSFELLNLNGGGTDIEPASRWFSVYKPVRIPHNDVYLAPQQMRPHRPGRRASSDASEYCSPDIWRLLSDNLRCFPFQVYLGPGLSFGAFFTLGILYGSILDRGDLDMLTRVQVGC